MEAGIGVAHVGQGPAVRDRVDEAHLHVGGRVAGRARQRAQLALEQPDVVRRRVEQAHDDDAVQVEVEVPATGAGPRAGEVDDCHATSSWRGASTAAPACGVARKAATARGSRARNPEPQPRCMAR